MTAIFVHGVPETPAVWQPVVDRLGREDVAVLQLPGFGCPLPDGFDATKESYAGWLAGELAAFHEVDLVSHDWGGLLTLRVLADRPTNVRSWACDMGDLADDFRWHDTARTWQTPGEGEALMEALLGASAEDRAAVLTAIGVPEAHAVEMGSHLDATMADAILRLYRSATEVGTDWGPGIDRIQAPGLLVESGKDPFRSPERVERLAARTGAEVASLPEAGHFWMLEDPEGVAGVLTAFWASC